MSMMKNLITVLLLLAIISCIDPFEIDLYDENAGGQLVVEGIITQEQKTHQIKLTRSAPVAGFSGYQAETGASVSIKDDLDNCYQLFEFQPGVYLTDSSDFKPTVGRSYKLQITLRDGTEYSSNFQLLKPIDEIDRLWARGEKETYLTGSVISESEKLNIYTNIDLNKNEFLRFDYSGVYQLKSAYQGSSVCWTPDEVIPPEILPLNDTITCFKNQNVLLPLNVYSFSNLNSNENFNQKIFSITPNRLFYYGYSMLVRKYVLTEDFYNYLADIKEQNNFGGDLFAPPPTAIEGNISEVGNNKNQALGFFSTSNMTSKRIFIDNEILKDPIRDPFNTDACYMDLDPAINVRPQPFCCDCRLLEGTTVEKPDVWPL
jgi:hypothetical protein